MRVSGSVTLTLLEGMDPKAAADTVLTALRQAVQQGRVVGHTVIDEPPEPPKAA